MMYSGKTTIGKLLSKKINFPLLDIDDELQKILDMPISKIFEIYGEKKFRIFEAVFFKECSKLDRHIFAPGGGIILNDESRLILKNNNAVFFLDSSPEIIYERFQKDNNKNYRPLLADGSIQLINKLYKKRYNIYKSCSDFIINTDLYSENQVVTQIEKYLNA